MADCTKEGNVGYLMASVERNTKQIDRLVGLFEKHAQQEEARSVRLKEEIQSMRNELNMYKTVIKVTKALGLTAACLLAFKFGDISDIWGDD
jgi:hypothetical protein